MYCSKCGTQSNEGELFCKNCGNPLQNNQLQLNNQIEMNTEIRNSTVKEKKAHKRKPIIIGLVIIAVVVIGVVAIISVLFNDNTDIYGTWQNEYKEGNYKFIKKYTFNTDGTGSYEETIYNKGEISDDQKTDLTNVKAKKINRDIEQVIFDNDKYDGNVVYKYKNYLGSFSEVPVPKKKIFDLKIVSDGGNVPSILYRKDGTVHFCYDYGNCENDDCGGFTYKYKLKKNLILLEGDQGWNEFAYIVEDGIFTIGYTKVESN